MKRGREKRLASAVCCDQRRAARVTAGDEVWAGWRSREPTASRPLAEQLGGLRPLWQPTSARHAPCAGPEGGKADPGIGTNQQWGGAARSTATTARRLQGPPTTVPSLPSTTAAVPPPRTHAQRGHPTACNRKLTSSGLLASSVMQLTAITDRINLSNSLRATMLLHNWRNVRLRLASTGTAAAAAFGVVERPAWPLPTVCSPAI